MNRAERRRAARRAAREGSAQMEAAAERGERPISFFTDTGQYDVAAANAELPSKVPGQHRWVATAGYTMTDAEVVHERRFQSGEVTTRTMLDADRRFVFAIGCYDCEEPFPIIQPGSVCPGTPLDDKERR
jgi:hypothetical protein